MISSEQHKSASPPSPPPVRKLSVNPDEKWSGLSAYMEHVRKSELEESDCEAEDQDPLLHGEAVRRSRRNSRATAATLLMKEEELGYEGELA